MTGVFFALLAMLIVANGAPVIAARLLEPRFALPVDLGHSLADGQRIFGASKTWRGLVAALVSSAVAAVLLGYSLQFGLILGALAMAGDLMSSFIKRRRGMEPSSRFTGLDQLPESLLPALYAVLSMQLPAWWIILLPGAFMALEIYLSKWLFKLKIRKRPY
jgi:hypothetical protein